MTTEVAAARTAATALPAKRTTATRTTAKPLLILALLAAGVGLFVVASARWQGQFDLKVYHGAVSHWAHGGDLYGYLLQGQQRSYGFTYPPFAALVMLPMAAVRWTVAAAILATCSLAATLFLLTRLLDPAIRSGWTVVGGAILLTAFEPWRDTLALGQINVLLLVFVAVDLLMLLGRSPLAGACVGLCAAIKLTPAIFILYLIVARRWRAAAVAVATCAAATGSTWLIAPETSAAYWRDALWQAQRVGDPAFVSNQSLSGLVHRLYPSDRGTALWLALVACVLALWMWRAGRAAAAGNHLAGLALTGAAACLVSPITWLHHLVWLLPAIAVLVNAAVRADRLPPHRPFPRRLLLAGAAMAAFGFLCSRVIWLFTGHYTGPGVVGANLGVLLEAALLLWSPIGATTARISGLDEYPQPSGSVAG